MQRAEAVWSDCHLCVCGFPLATWDSRRLTACPACSVEQGIFLHIDCVPFWDAAPFHWDAAPPNFRSLRPKAKTLLMLIKITLKINEIMQKNEQVIHHYAWLCRAPRPSLHCPAPPPVMLCLACPMPYLTYCSALPCPALS